MLRKILSLLHNKIFIVAVLILIQLGVFFGIVFQLSEYFVWIYFLLIALSFIISVYVINRNDNPTYKMTWVLLIMALPVFGGLIYLLFGGQKVPKELRIRDNQAFSEYKEIIWQNAEIMEELQNSDTAAFKQANYLWKNAGFPIYKHTETTFFPIGEDKFTVMVEELKKAEKFIFLEYFIIAPGVMWDTILDILIEKVKQGVEVRVLYDDAGCITTLAPDYYKVLQGLGMKAKVFNPIKPRLAIQTNNRDHRKILVIDGKVGMTGGINLADEYINAEQRFGYWKDAALRVEGDAAWNFTVMFLNFWNAFRLSETDYDAFRPMPLVTPVSDGIVQPYADSPLDEEPMAETVYLNILAQAQRYVYIYTPYLAVGEEMLDALKNAAKRGVDIRLVLPGIPDKKLVFRLSRSYYLPLLRAGVRIYEYTPGFLHAKCWVSDDVTAVVGSINMDYRSLFLHFECGVLLQKNSQVAVLRDDVRATLPQCREIQVTECRTSLPGTVLDSVLRLLSPLM